MKLAEYIDLNAIDKREFACLIGVTVVSLNRYLSGERRPEWPVLAVIRKVTGGQVTPNDFLEVDDLPPNPPKGQAAA